MFPRALRKKTRQNDKKEAISESLLKNVDMLQLSWL